MLLNKTPIKVVKEVKFLGLLLDSKLSFIPHIKALKTKCLKALDLLKVISSTKWGGDEQTLLHLYRSLVRSKLDYGSIIYGSARPSYIKQLDTVHHFIIKVSALSAQLMNLLSTREESSWLYNMLQN